MRTCSFPALSESREPKLARTKTIILVALVAVAAAALTYGFYPRGSPPSAEIVKDQTACWAVPGVNGSWYDDYCVIAVQAAQGHSEVRINSTSLGRSTFDAPVQACGVIVDHIFPPFDTYQLNSSEAFVFDEPLYYHPPPPTYSPGQTIHVVVVFTNGYNASLDVTAQFSLTVPAAYPQHVCP